MVKSRYFPIFYGDIRVQEGPVLQTELVTDGGSTSRTSKVIRGGEANWRGHFLA